MRRALFPALLGALLLAPASFAQDAEPGADVAAEGAIVKIEITETFDKEPTKHLPATYFVRKKLRDAGFTAYSTASHPQFAKDHEKEVAAAEKAGTEAKPLIEDLEDKPAPDLVITGTCAIAFERTSDFYGAKLATFYAALCQLQIADGEGNVLATIELDDEWGKTDKTRAQREARQRIGLFAAADVLSSEPIQARMSDAAKASAKTFCDKINKKRRQSSEQSGG